MDLLRLVSPWSPPFYEVAQARASSLAKFALSWKEAIGRCLWIGLMLHGGRV